MKLDRYLESGGGVFCMAYVANADEGIRPMLDPWDVRLPLERYVEEDVEEIEAFPRMRGNERACLVDQVLDSPISHGVRRLWMPYGEAYNTSWTAPVAFGPDWQVVVRGSATSRSEPVDLGRSTMPGPADALVRPGGVNQPDLFIEAVSRPVEPGRLQRHVAANNPTDRPITARFRQALAVPDLDLKPQTHTLEPGQYRVLSE